MRAPEGEFPLIAADILGRLRQLRPRVHCVTNAVAQTFTANILLAVGAMPTMTIAPDEVADFVRGADAMLVNLGTLDASRREAIGIAIDKASELGVRWIFDPVFIDRSQGRAIFAEALVRMRPTAMHLNDREFLTIAASRATATAAARYARDVGAVIALTGETDLVTDGAKSIRIANGHPWMSLVTAMGCAGAGLVAACLAVEPDPWRATGTGVLALSIAGEIAAETARGPGSLATGIIDALHRLDRTDLLARARFA
ncbi:MAG: hydroxyethylthiazole kinase [Rhodoplanes sp.]|jgi:hydroxyethylthiazole kinase